MIYDPPGPTLTLDVEEHPRADRRPVQIVVGEAPPVAQEADGHVGNPTANGPRDGRSHALQLNPETDEVMFSLNGGAFSHRCSLRVQRSPLISTHYPDESQDNLQHKIHDIDDDQGLLALSVRVGQVAALQGTLLEGVGQGGTQNPLDHVAALKSRIGLVVQRPLRLTSDAGKGVARF